MDDRTPSDDGACPDAERLVQFARGLLDGATHDLVRDHARGCEECGLILAAFTRGPRARLDAEVEVADTAFAFGPVTGTAAGASSVKLGDLIGQKYRVDRLVGAGGMGVVVAATHVQIGRSVALKFMRPEACQSAEGVARFVREARACAKIQSEHVARLLDVGTLDGGEPFMVMELLTGTDLADLVRSGGPLEVEDAVDYVLQAGEAVAEAHGLGIIHRDLKPANLFLSRRPDGSPLLKVLDFGISKLSVDDVESSVGLTSSRVAMGSPKYMSPEQLESPRTVGAATDVWAFGCILFELLTGEAAFGGETVHAVGLAIATKPAPKATAFRPGLPRLVDEVIHACLEKDPHLRVPSVADLALLLAPLSPSRSRLSIERICRLTGRPPPLGEATPLPGTPRETTRVFSPTKLAVAVAAFGAALLVSTLAFTTSRWTLGREPTVTDPVALPSVNAQATSASGAQPSGSAAVAERTATPSVRSEPVRTPAPPLPSSDLPPFTANATPESPSGRRESRVALVRATSDGLPLLTRHVTVASASATPASTPPSVTSATPISSADTLRDRK